MLKESINKNLHRVLHHDPFTNEITGSIGLSLDSFDEDMESLKSQLNIDTATWSLAVYEKELGLRTDVSKPLDERRSVIKSKLRGTGKVGAAQIKVVAAAYSNGDVEVTLKDGITVEFVSSLGVPPNIDDLKQLVREITPAHLTINYIFRFYTYGEMAATGLTYEEIAATGLTYEEIMNRGLT